MRPPRETHTPPRARAFSRPPHTHARPAAFARARRCPPNHAFDDDDPAERDAALARRAAELEGKPVTKQAVNVDGDKIERIGAIIDEIAKS